MSATIRVGTAGWSYRDWEGPVYPKEARRDPLSYLISFFSCLEVNSTFYRIPEPSTVERWARVASGHPDFRFTAKLYRGMTHGDNDGLSVTEVEAFKEAMRPLVEPGLLGAILVQFPFYFKAQKKTAEHLSRLAEAFRDYPLALEVRDRSWIRPETLELIASMGYGFCNIDLPQAQNSIPPGDCATSSLGYFRIHGRNANAWFDREAGRDQKYDYLYSEEEVDFFVDLITSLSQRTEEVYVIANNHFAGQAPANALELSAKLLGPPRSLPEPLVAAYPRLASLSERQT